MDNDELRNLFTAIAVVVSLLSFGLTYRNSRKSQDSLLHARKLAVRLLKNKVAEEHAVASSALDGVSTHADALLVEYQYLVNLYPKAIANPLLSGLEEKLQKLRATIEGQNEAEAKGKVALAKISDSDETEKNELALTELLGTVRDTAIQASSKAWSADLYAAEKIIDRLLKQYEKPAVLPTAIRTHKRQRRLLPQFG